MAIIKLGALIAGIRGTIGGITYSANKSGTYAKPWGKSSNPHSEMQSLRRGAFGIFNYTWQNMSSALKADWDTWAALPAQARINSLGDTYYMSGYNAFIMIQARRSSIGAVPSTTVPTGSAPTAPTLTDFVVYKTATGGSYIEYPVDEFDGLYLIAFIAASSGEGPQVWYPDYFQVVADSTPDDDVELIQTELEAVFGTISSDQRFFLKLHAQDSEGLRSSATTGDCLVA